MAYPTSVQYFEDISYAQIISGIVNNDIIYWDVNGDGTEFKLWRVRGEILLTNVATGADAVAFDLIKANHTDGVDEQGAISKVSLKYTGVTLDALLTQLTAINNNTNDLELKADTVNLNVEDLENLITELNSNVGDVNDADTLNTIIGRLKQTLTRFGEVQASPTAYTLLGRLKAIEDALNVLTSSGMAPGITSSVGLSITTTETLIVNKTGDGYLDSFIYDFDTGSNVILRIEIDGVNIFNGLITNIPDSITGTGGVIWYDTSANTIYFQPHANTVPFKTNLEIGLKTSSGTRNLQKGITTFRN